MPKQYRRIGGVQASERAERKREQGQPRLTPTAATGRWADGFHDRRWADGPPEAWLAEHEAFLQVVHHV